MGNTIKKRKDNPFQVKFVKGAKTRFPTVYIYNFGIATVWPTSFSDKKQAINESIDRAISALNEWREE